MFIWNLKILFYAFFFFFKFLHSSPFAWGSLTCRPPFIPPPFGYSSWGRSFDWQLEEPDTQTQQWPALPRLYAPRLGNRGPAVPGPFHQDWAITATPHCLLHQIAGLRLGDEGVGRSLLWMSVTGERRRKKKKQQRWKHAGSKGKKRENAKWSSRCSLWE